MFESVYNRDAKISLRQRVRERQCNIAVVFVTIRFHFVDYYNNNGKEPRKNTRNDYVSTHKFRSRTRCHCRSEIVTSLIRYEIFDFRK